MGGYVSQQQWNKDILWSKVTQTGVMVHNFAINFEFHESDNSFSKVTG